MARARRTRACVCTHTHTLNHGSCRPIDASGCGVSHLFVRSAAHLRWMSGSACARTFLVVQRSPPCARLLVRSWATATLTR
eukprot:4108494-Prymnesium_polylepis.1